MLFDLQSRRRRTAVKIIYLFLAILMGGGLVLFGVGTGSGGGGLLNAVGNNSQGGNSVQTSQVTQSLRRAEAQVKAAPTSAAAWQALFEARYAVAGTGANFNSNLGEFTASGIAELKQVIAAWNRYTALVKGQPSATLVLQAARVFTATGDYAGATIPWQDYIAQNPSAPRGYTCLALTGYAAKQTSLADEAAKKAEALAPKLQQLQVKAGFTQAKASASTAQQLAASEC